MERIALKRLNEWKNKQNRKPLIVQGARQVGKTWLMREFGRLQFSKVAYFIFEQNEQLKALFEKDVNTDRLLESLGILAGFKITPDDTLIIFDEIQECPNALTSLKYFYEQKPEYHIIAAGSLLGVALHGGISFPVGKVEFLNLYPLSFYEFLSAMGQDMALEQIRKNNFAVLTPLHDTFIDWVKRYFYVGGMPEVVKAFAEHRDYQEVRSLQQAILRSYENDFSKHIPKDGLPKLKMLWSSIPGQLAKENKKFIYSKIQKGARAKEFENALTWLEACGLIYKVCRVKKPDLPLVAYQDLTAFKIYVSDVGLLSAMSSLDAKTLLSPSDIFEEFKEALTEQYVLQELKNLPEMPLAYWANESGTNEVDFVIQTGSEIVPVEVKASTNLRAKSLKWYMEKFNPDRAVRLSAATFKQENKLTDLPLYAVPQIISMSD